MQVIFYISLNSSFAFAKHHSSSLLAVKASPSPRGEGFREGVTLKAQWGARSASPPQRETVLKIKVPPARIENSLSPL